MYLVQMSLFGTRRLAPIEMISGGNRGWHDNLCTPDLLTRNKWRPHGTRSQDGPIYRFI
jgi:hypothetical protein